MTRNQEIEKLRKFPHFYLWKKIRCKWTYIDLVNLANLESLEEELTICKKNPQKQRIAEVVNGKTIEYKSVAEASRKTGININLLYQLVNGRKVSNKINWIKI